MDMSSAGTGALGSPILSAMFRCPRTPRILGVVRNQRTKAARYTGSYRVIGGSYTSRPRAQPPSATLRSLGRHRQIRRPFPSSPSHCPHRYVFTHLRVMEILFLMNLIFDPRQLSIPQRSDQSSKFQCFSSESLQAV